MLKLTVAVLAVALTSAASAGGWRNLRIDGSSEASFTQSVEAFTDKLPLARREVFVHALQDIWTQGVTAAKAANREYTAGEYFRQVDGLGYDEVVTLLDPTGETAEARYRETTRLYARARMAANERASPWPEEHQGWAAENQGWPGDAAFTTPQSIEHALAPAPQ
jgi:hypothetical protein